MAEFSFQHTSVLLSECIEGLHIREGLTYVDCTTGGGGHSYEIAKRLGSDAELICFDRDPSALFAAQKKLSDYSDKITYIHENFSELGNILKEKNIQNLGGVLMDLGCSSHQFDTAERGFSYMQDAPLDMRMDPSAPLTAYDVVNGYGEAELKNILFTYGEERFAPRIVAKIAAERKIHPIESTLQLSELIKSAIPKPARMEGHHPAKRTFQAIRIEVNKELDAITPAIRAAEQFLVPGGRIVIISFHSLEDRLVKGVYTELASGCECPREFPVCVCGKKPKIRILTKKPILPTEEELQNNPRSRSAKLRIAEKL